MKYEITTFSNYICYNNCANFNGNGFIYSKSNTSKVDSTESVLLEVFLCLSYAFLIGCEAIYFNMRTAVCMASTEICS